MAPEWMVPHWAWGDKDLARRFGRHTMLLHEDVQHQGRKRGEGTRPLAPLTGPLWAL